MTVSRKSFVGAIEGGGTKFVCAVGLDADEFLAHQTIPTSDPAGTGAKIQDFFDMYAAEFGPYDAMGIGTFGPVGIDPEDLSYGVIQKTPKPGWSNFSYPDLLARYDCPLAIKTDVDAAAVGEFAAQQNQGLAPLAYVTVGTGVGVGLANGSGPICGTSHYEIGHIRVPRDGADAQFRGRCPFHHDCLEGLVCGPAIQDRWGGRLDQLPADCGATEIVAGYLAHLAYTITLTHMPRQIVFGGGVAKAAGLISAIRPRLRDLLGDYLQANHLNGDLRNYIVGTQLGNHAGLQGARLLALQAIADR